MKKVQISPLLFSIAVFETIFWLSFTLCVTTSAVAIAQPTQAYIHNQNELLTQLDITNSIEHINFEPPTGYDHLEAAILLQEHYAATHTPTTANKSPPDRINNLLSRPKNYLSLRRTHAHEQADSTNKGAKKSKSDANTR